MIKQLIIPLSAVAAFIVIVGLIYKNPEKFGSYFKTPAPSVFTTNKSITINGNKINVQVVDTAEKRKVGLGGVNSLGETQGMLFVFEPTDTNPIFWMKDMLIDIDIIWIKNGKVVQIDKNVKAPAANTPDAKLELIKTSTPVDLVLEVNAGYSDKNNIKVGDQTQFYP